MLIEQETKTHCFTSLSARSSTSSGSAPPGTMPSQNAKSASHARERTWPYSIVWTPLPFVTWFIPIIGHTGITSSRGIIHDFSDDFNVSVDNFSFGNPTKFYQFESNQIANDAAGWDKAIQETSDWYSRTRHSLCFNNCHQYIAGVLNKVKYGGKNDWTQTGVWYKITFESRYVDFMGFVRQWCPFLAILLTLGGYVKAMRLICRATF